MHINNLKFSIITIRDESFRFLMGQSKQRNKKKERKEAYYKRATMSAMQHTFSLDKNPTKKYKNK